MRAILLAVGMAALVTIPGAGPATATDIQATPVGVRVGRSGCTIITTATTATALTAAICGRLACAKRISARSARAIAGATGQSVAKGRLGKHRRPWLCRARDADDHREDAVLVSGVNSVGT
jgi:hypothetical protein